ncbi:hypothetical protein [Luteirhabdus pelagi]|jgi:hypothetical protein|uniref:hypothetical protein n=1 Tax=Luteirhabdus pelagi TaxID=2792783 RepID=UPI0019394683|nr:hypothetical protein [Luteirhabdus pelagi]
MKKILFLVIAMLLLSCSSTKVISDWKSPDTPIFEANKVLVVGMSSNNDVRRQFEDAVADALEKEDVIAVRSIDFFEDDFRDAQKTEESINAIETTLLEAGFDAILVSRTKGKENKVSVGQAFRSLQDSFPSFTDYYYGHQNTPHNEQVEAYEVYHTETTLYCICPTKDRELLWVGQIDVVAPNDQNRSISDYAKTLLEALKQQQLLVY